LRYRLAMEQALYGPQGFYTRHRPAAHFRTSAHSPVFAQAIAALIALVDRALGHPARFDIVDVGAGQGELLSHLGLSDRFVKTPVELGEPVPSEVTGLLLATEWLDNVPLDLAQDGHYLDDGAPLSSLDRAWVDRWWPGAQGIVEIGRSRDEAWASVVGKLRAGVALTVDYGHFLGTRPSLPTLTGFRDGREVEPLLDGSTDITCHVAIDSVAAAPGLDTRVLTQREALHWLGVNGARPPLDLAHRDPAAYVRALATASEAGTLTDPNGLGGHWWVLHTLGCAL
jgi:SAM-dependent MidA family methyltransferase